MVKQYLNFLRNTSVNIFEQFFYIQFDDGFLINFDYISPITEKFDIKIRYNKENAEF